MEPGRLVLACSALGLSRSCSAGHKGLPCSVLVLCMFQINIPPLQSVLGSVQGQDRPGLSLRSLSRKRFVELELQSVKLEQVINSIKQFSIKHSVRARSLLSLFLGKR